MENKYQPETDQERADRLEQQRKRDARNLARREREQTMKDCGLVRGKDSMGRTIWE